MNENKPVSLHDKRSPSNADQTVGTFYNVETLGAKESDNFFYIDAKEKCFEISGIKHPSENGGMYYRLNYAEKARYSDANAFLAASMAGARIRFRTTAAKFAIDAEMASVNTGMVHFANRGAFGFDVYTGSGESRKYAGEIMQFMTDEKHMQTVVNLPENNGKPLEVMIDLPLYGGVSSVRLGFNKGDTVAKPLPYTYQNPVAFYGSSITQGGCVSRPGTAYFHLVTRALDANCMNLGFSGSALGEQPVAEYIAASALSAFVMDYDFNSPTPEHLAETHYPFFKTVRDAQPTLPIIIMSHPYFGEPSERDKKKTAIVKATYEKAIDDGDKNVSFIDGGTFFPEEMRDIFAVDFLHPNDSGHYKMAQALYPVLRDALERRY